ncbi:hypothetical protein [Yinghuangia seranimata]|uniref:hypothetical protein n=1 Tax=Yinghuangia seranimata TaxID=408067 RepID=UPI00248B85D7|nr:hypothetical protein [Yinghuangia seranimata]MDI2124851.1 hypothetical protein [Yinghuangia seranimata]
MTPVQPDDATTPLTGWIMRPNLRPFLRWLCTYAAYDLGPLDLDAIEFGIEHTDDESPNGWYTYPIVGSLHAVELHLAVAVGSDVLSLRLHGAHDPTLRTRVETLINVFSEYA